MSEKLESTTELTTRLINESRQRLNEALENLRRGLDEGVDENTLNDLLTRLKREYSTLQAQHVSWGHEQPEQGPGSTSTSTPNSSGDVVHGHISDGGFVPDEDSSAE